MLQKFTAGPFTDGSTQELDITFPLAMPVVGSTPHTFGKPGHSQAAVAFGVITPAPPPPPPPPPSGGPNIDPAFLASIGISAVTRLDPGDAVMLNPSHWNLQAHGQGNGNATTNVPALAKYGQSYYGGPTDSYLHCSIGQGTGLWMVGDQMPVGKKWIAEFSATCGGPDPFHAYGWGLGWVLGSNGQELDIMETVNWGSGQQGYCSSTYRDRAGHVVGSYYNAAFPCADGKPHTYSLIWDAPNAMQYLVWDRAQQGHGLAIVNPLIPMSLQIMSGYTATSSTQPPVFDARADNVYQYFRYWEAT